ncbi:hypothetical protein HDV01_005253 [Terramyces sp. JEL0728]|nr:hypothetical protein HDV01_005240 [Terramyces sp. JEL0728]KAJ3272825.1 hypothetical protein HDV01_005253 [Terramyces sp. JEL0728]
MSTITNFISNAHTPVSGETLPVQSPGTGKTIAHVQLSTQDQVNSAVEQAHSAFLSWSNRTVKDRVQYLIRFHQLVIKHKDELADLITKEEALAEIAKGNETVEFAISLPQLMLGHTLEVSRGVYCQDVRRPHGVAEAGFPEGVVNIVNGTANTVQLLCDHPKTKAVTFVGTSHVAELLSHRCRLLNKRIIALGGAKNHLVASRDCNIDMASSDIVASFTGCSGQRCMAASVLLTLGKQPELLNAIVQKAKAFVPGQAGKGVMGPVIDQVSRDKIIGYINDSEKTGAQILLDGRTWLKDEKLVATGGFWVGPTVVLHKNKQDKALHDEIFGPVISIYECENQEEAIAMENENPYGNAACIYTNSGAIADWFTKRFSAGMIGVNIGVPVPREPFSFGGINRSKFGDFDITGHGGMEFFTSSRKTTTKWVIPKEANWMN